MGELRQKIDELFTYRKFPLLYEIADVSGTEAKEYNEKLITLQESIYHLDAYLEGNYAVAQDKLDAYWVEIHKQLVICGAPASEVDDYSRHIYRYQKHELGLRSGKTPLRFSLEHFYFYKSCDVKLLRRLLMERFDGLRAKCSNADWRYFDLVTEVNDDVEDIYEDIGVINGNLFYLKVQRDGLAAAEQQFGDFLDYVAKASTERFEKADDFGQLIHQWTLAEVYDTMQLLTDRIENVDVSELEQLAVNAQG